MDPAGLLQSTWQEYWQVPLINEELYIVTKCFPLETYITSTDFKSTLFSISVPSAGSLGTSVFDMNAVLVGASGGVYALLAAHVANILLVS